MARYKALLAIGVALVSISVALEYRTVRTKAAAPAAASPAPTTSAIQPRKISPLEQCVVSNLLLEQEIAKLQAELAAIKDAADSADKDLDDLLDTISKLVGLIGSLLALVGTVQTLRNRASLQV